MAAPTVPPQLLASTQDESSVTVTHIPPVGDAEYVLSRVYYGLPGESGTLWGTSDAHEALAITGLEASTTYFVYAVPEDVAGILGPASEVVVMETTVETPSVVSDPQTRILLTLSFSDGALTRVGP